MKRKILQTLFLCFGVGAVSAQTTQISGFADATAAASSDNQTTPNKMIKNHIELGAIDMFITSQFDKVNFLGEVAFEGNRENGDGIVDIERLLINYRIQDYFQISLGKFYAPLGYWSSSYNHGALIKPTIGNPEVLGDAFWEADHFSMKKQAGVEVIGEGITKYNFGYTMAITNGITDMNFMDDANVGKAVSLDLHIDPVENFRVFVSGLKDVVPSGQNATNGSVLLKNTDFSIMNGGVAYMGSENPLEFIGEYFNISNNMTGTTTNTQGYFLYAGYRIKKYVPYVSYDVLHYSKEEQYFNKNNSDAFILGLRYTVNPRAVIKMEYKYHKYEMAGIENRLQMQFTFGF